MRCCLKAEAKPQTYGTAGIRTCPNQVGDGSIWTGAPGSPQRIWAEKDGRSPSNASVTWAKDRGQGQENSWHGVKAFEKSVFVPCTLRRTWRRTCGTRPEMGASFFDPVATGDCGPQRFKGRMQPTIA